MKGATRSRPNDSFVIGIWDKFPIFRRLLREIRRKKEAYEIIISHYLIINACIHSKNFGKRQRIQLQIYLTREGIKC